MGVTQMVGTKLTLELYYFLGIRLNLCIKLIEFPNMKELQVNYVNHSQSNFQSSEVGTGDTSHLHISTFRPQLEMRSLSFIQKNPFF